MQPREQRLRDRAGRQWGVVTWQHLVEDGFGCAAVQRRVDAGRLVRRHRGVYVVGHVPLAPEGIDLAAVYAVGGDAVLGELSGAVRMGMLRFPGAKVDVTTAARGRRAQIDGVDLHQTRSLPSSDRTVPLGIPIATVERILLDLAARQDISDRALESAAAQAERYGACRARRSLRSHGAAAAGSAAPGCARRCTPARTSCSATRSTAPGSS